MQEHEVNEKQMTALTALASVTMDISKARATLAKLEEGETEYLVSREKKAVDRITKVLADSHSLVEETNKNYEQVIEFAEAVKSAAAFLVQVHDSFTEYIGLFDRSKTEWERDIANQEETVNALRAGLKIERVKIDNERKSLDTQNLQLNEKQKKLDSDRGALDRSIKRLREGKI